MLDQILGPWVAPLLLIPGMALLTIPTGNRYSQLVLFVAQHGETPRSVRHLSLLRRALMALYFGIGVDALGALFGGLLTFWPTIAPGLIVGFTCVGVGLLVLAIGFLIMDVWREPCHAITQDSL